MNRDKQLTLAGVATVANVEKSILLACKNKSKKHDVQQVKGEAHVRAERAVQLLLTDSYAIKEYREFDICERGKQRHIQHVCLCNSDNLDETDGGILRFIVDTIEHDFLNYVTDNTHAAIKYHGTHRALKQLRRYLRTDPEGTAYCYKIDVYHYFPSISREVLMQEVRRLWSDPQLLAFLDHIIMSAPGDIGIPIGNHTSQIFANIYLGRFDHWLQNTYRDVYYLRYMDDIVVLAGSKDRLRQIHREVEWYFARNLNLKIKQNWQIFPVESRGIDFVGYRVWANRVLLRRSTLNRTIKALKEIKEHVLMAYMLTDHDVCVLESRLGAIYHCTPKVRHTLFMTLIQPIRFLLPPETKLSLPGGPEIWYTIQREHTRKSKTMKKCRISSSAQPTSQLSGTCVKSQQRKNSPPPRGTR